MKKIIAVSGGPDSIYLLNWAIEEYGTSDIVVAHVNYKKREQADKEQLMVEAFCIDNGISFRTLVVSKDVYNSYGKYQNFQDQARRIRYDFFKEVALDNDSSEILIAHNKDDFLETAMMLEERSNDYLFYGIKEENQLGNFTIKRPLLDIWKEDISASLDKREITYFIDSSNNSDEYKRNSIRIENNNKGIEWKENKVNYYFTKNDSKKELRNQVDSLYIEWVNSEYSTKFFSDIKREQLIAIMYKYLINCDADINITNSKVNDLANFVTKTGNEWKEFRLSDNANLSKKNQQLRLVLLKDNI